MSHNTVTASSALWNFTGHNIKRFYTAWRKCVRRIIGVPNTTHCNLLHRICDDHEVVVQLLSRCITFMNTIVKSCNYLTNLCLRIAINGSQSYVSNTMSLISELSHISRYDLCNMSSLVFRRKCVPPHDPALHDTVRVICDILTNSIDFLTAAQLKDMLYILCTD